MATKYFPRLLNFYDTATVVGPTSRPYFLPSTSSYLSASLHILGFASPPLPLCLAHAQTCRCRGSTTCRPTKPSAALLSSVDLRIVDSRPLHLYVDIISTSPARLIDFNNQSSLAPVVVGTPLVDYSCRSTLTDLPRSQCSCISSVLEKIVWAWVVVWETESSSSKPFILCR